jgi:nucleoside-diphosphate-sugar epimerase
MAEMADLAGRSVLVTGATGFLGTHLVRALTAAGARVHALRRRPDQGTRLPSEGVAWHLADLTDPAALGAAVEAAAPEVVFHLAAYGTAFGQQDRETALRVNVEGSLGLWRALDGVRCRLVMAGSCGEYGQARGQVREDLACRPTWFYPATKNAAVVLLSTLGRQEGREVVTLRPFGPYGPADNLDRVVPHVLASLLAGREVAVTPGEQLRDYAHVDDHVQAFLLAATRPLPETGAIYNVGSGEVVRLRDLLEGLAAAVGGEAPGLLRFGAVPYRDSEIWEMTCSIEAARRDLGYEPRIPLAEGLRRTADWYRNRQGGMA